ncbi:MAG TPA: ATP-binding cassette domain-containing protein [Methanospirillum sp.]|nr:ATP-binding cassette domain-containing protein [Methanospirillum sp.]
MCPKVPPSEPICPMLLEMQNITVIRSDKTVLDQISLSIPEGEHVAILGPNGSGKSSLIKAITREYYPVIPDDDYIFRIWGRDQWHVFDLRSHLGIVSGDLQYTFTREITGRDMIRSGFFSSIGLFNHEITATMDQKVQAISSFLEIDHLMDRSVQEMSSGEARRCLIGRALVHDPKALILDEPTNSLDLHALHTLRSTMRQIAGSGTAIILVTHNLPDIIPEISRVIMIRSGRIYQDGPKTEILTSEHISRLFSVPVTIQENEGYYYATGY